MRCSSCEVLLDRYVEGTLPPKQMQAIGEHLRSCESCTFLVTELRVIDALLATSKSIELAPNFTFAVMAEVRSMPAVTPRTRSIWALLSFYVVGAWIALSAGLLALGPRIAVLSTFANQTRASFAEAFSAFSGAAHALGPSAPLVTAFVIGVLTIDLALVAGLILFYRNVRPRLAAHLATSEVL